jgi:mRNA interferase MazF
MSIARGEVWDVNFDPSEGDEIQKKRPAVVMSEQGVYALQLLIVVPITGWKPKFERHFWMVKIPASTGNGLYKDSAATAIQVKSVSQNRFVEKRGQLTPLQLDEIAAAIALCVGYSP